MIHGVPLKWHAKHQQIEPPHALFNHGGHHHPMTPLVPPTGAEANNNQPIPLGIVSARGVSADTIFRFPCRAVSESC
jgi:hypothetical protein